MGFGAIFGGIGEEPPPAHGHVVLLPGPGRATAFGHATVHRGGELGNQFRLRVPGGAGFPDVGGKVIKLTGGTPLGRPPKPPPFRPKMIFDDPLRRA
jgi:hypothetical protein